MKSGWGGESIVNRTISGFSLTFRSIHLNSAPRGNHNIKAPECQANLKKKPVIFAYCVFWGTLIGILGVMPIAASFLPEAAAQVAVHDATIVLDAGHGGPDTGARGPEGTLEKTLTLALVQMVADELRNRYRVVLTRTGDYALDIPGRTAVANQEGADLFISIHAGGSFMHQAKGVTIYFFKELPGVRFPEASPGGAVGLEPWDTVQYRHQSASRAFAEQMRSHLAGADGHGTVSVEAASLMILRGADMPAVLIEIGYLTNPLEEKTLRDTDKLWDLAKRIGSGTEAFMLNPR